jgi:hypothetical protein
MTCHYIIVNMVISMIKGFPVHFHDPSHVSMGTGLWDQNAHGNGPAIGSHGDIKEGQYYVEHEPGRGGSPRVLVLFCGSVCTTDYRIRKGPTGPVIYTDTF